jgi:uncharacterized protein (TIGR02300 family)
VHIVAKTEWGLKRICQSCGARFYDLGKSPIACPKCGTEFDPEAILKSRRGKTQAVAERAPAPAPEPEAEEVEAADEEVAAEEGEEEEEAVMEDTSELGEDNDDVAEVIENVNDEEER